MAARTLPAEAAFAPDFTAGRDGARAPRFLEELRKQGRGRFEALGFPTGKTEAWRFTSVRPITQVPWERSTREATRPPQALPQGVRIRRISEAVAAVEPHLGRIAGLEDNAFAALNTALFGDGFLVEIAKGAVVPEPIALSFGGSAGDEARIARQLARGV